MWSLEKCSSDARAVEDSTAVTTFLTYLRRKYRLYHRRKYGFSYSYGGGIAVFCLGYCCLLRRQYSLDMMYARQARNTPSSRPDARKKMTPSPEKAARKALHLSKKENITPIVGILFVYSSEND